MPEFDRPRIVDPESNPVSIHYPTPNVFEGNRSLIVDEPETKGKLAKAYEWTYGVVAVGLIGGALAFEQSPTNEKWRIQKGLETLVETGSPEAVERTVRLVTLPIEVIPAFLIGLAVHSNNPVIQGARNAFQNWQEGGEKRIEYRGHIKGEQRAIQDNWKRLVEEEKLSIKEKEQEPKDYWENLVIQDKEQRQQEKNAERVAKGKRSKMTSLEKKEAKLQKKRTESYWKELVKQDRLDRRETKLEFKAGEQQEKNNKRVAEGKKPKAYNNESLLRRSVDVAKNELTDAFLALGLGAGIVIFKEAISNKDVSIKRTILTGAKATLIISYVSGKIGYFIAAGTQAAQWEIPGTDHVVHYEKQAQWLVDYGTDTKALMAILLAAYTPGVIKKLYHRMPKRELKFQKWLNNKQLVKPTCEPESLDLQTQP